MVFLENRKYVRTLECEVYFLNSLYSYFPTLSDKEDNIAHMRSTKKFDLHLYCCHLLLNIFTLTTKDRMITQG